MRQQFNSAFYGTLFFLSGLCLISHSAFAAPEAWQPKGIEQIHIWPHGAPDSPKTASEPESADVSYNVKRFGPLPVTGIRNVTDPTISIFPPKGANSGAAVVVFPGGGYKILAIDLEGTEACDWLTAKGITCIVLKYRVPDSGPHWDAKLKKHVMPKVFTALQDAQRSIGLIRADAAKLKIDPNKIGVLGFSAGGHLVAAISTNYKKRIYPSVDAADKVSCRPNFAMALYPGHMALIKDGHDDLTQPNPDIQITRETPPTFIVAAENDPVDPIEYSLIYFKGLRKAKVPAELHIYAEGGHAFALRRNEFPITHWTDLADTWLATIGIIKKSN